MTPADHHGVPDTDFYDATYSETDQDLQAAIRRDAFGEDIGQFSWLTADEYRRFFSWLDLDAWARVLDVASGSGGPAPFMARTVGCMVTGIDIHEEGLAKGNREAERESLGERVRFLCSDAREPLGFPDESLRRGCLHRLDQPHLRTGSALSRVAPDPPTRRSGLFTDPITVTGMLRRQEILVRSGGMGEFVFTPFGFDGMSWRSVASRGSR